MQDLNITLIQSKLHWEDINGNLKMFEKQVDRIENRTDLIILPEMFTTGFSMQPERVAEPIKGKAFDWMQKTAERTNSAIIGSVAVTENDRFYNMLFATLPNGEYHTYAKKHLFAYAGEDEAYTEGKERLVFEWKNWKICPMICYDLRFPVWARNHFSPIDNSVDYDLLLYVANWPKPRIKAWDTLLEARAIENQTYVVGVNRTGVDVNGYEYIGHSAVYDYAGESLVFNEGEITLLQTSLSKEKQNSFRKKLPFLKDGDNFSFKDD